MVEQQPALSGAAVSQTVPPSALVDAVGTVIEVDGDHAVVRLDETGCGRCQEEGGCGGHNIGTMLCATPRSFRLANPDHKQVGDRVHIVIADGALRRGAMLAYGWPLLALLAGAFAGSAVAGDAGAIAGGLAALIGVWLLLRRYLPSRAGNEHLADAEPRIRS